MTSLPLPLCIPFLSLLCLGLLSGPARGQEISPKKGIAIALRHENSWQRIESLNVSWFYNWMHQHKSGKPEDLVFVPMMWGLRGNPETRAAALIRAKEAGKVDTLLGFNEPDGKKQANLSVQQALEAWPVLEKTGLRLGSPATVHPDNDWMTTFMDKAEDLDLRVDFVCVHWYGGPNEDQFIRRLKEVHRMYDRPIWITEFAVADWKSSSVENIRHSRRDIAKFMKEVLDELEDLKFVERYSWFSARPDDKALGNSALFDAEGNLTELGKIYSAHRK